MWCFLKCNTSQATPESVWAAIQALTEKQAETDRILRESRIETERILRESRIETERILNEKFAEVAAQQAATDRQIKATDRKIEKTERQMKATDKKIASVTAQLGGMGNSHGSFAEEYFFNAFEDGETDFFGEKFDEISENLKYNPPRASHFVQSTSVFGTVHLRFAFTAYFVHSPPLALQV